MTATVPIIVVTGQTDPVYQGISEGVGAMAHMTKPFSAILVATVPGPWVGDRAVSVRAGSGSSWSTGASSRPTSSGRPAVRATRRSALGRVLLAMGALSLDQLNWALSELVGVPYVDLTEDMVDLDGPGRSPRRSCGATRRFRSSGWPTR